MAKERQNRVRNWPAQNPPAPLQEKIDRFIAHRSNYLDPTYGEATLRVDFLDSLFIALGWDVHNDKDGGVSERYKDVVVEQPLSVDGHTLRTDYIFRIGETEKFIVEAKKPHVDILTSQDSAYQLRHYAWNKHHRLCVLTNFDKFVVYELAKAPKHSDPPNVGRIGQFTVEEYRTRWPDIASVFSKEAVLKGYFDDEAEETERQGSEPVDKYFLNQLEEWRRDMAVQLKLRNQVLTQPELNFAVQTILNRIVFLRICEDRGAEPHGRVQACTSGGPVYGRLLELFRLADQRYNSGLFHFDEEKGRPSVPDRLTPQLTIDDDVLRKVIRQLYDSPYDFRQIPIEVLGQVYEQFLGKVIVVTEKRARVEEKPEVRKAGGVFYTPQYVVDYIVKHTLGAMLEGKTPEQVTELKVLDPACGSGSFLLRAYQCLLDWHLDQYAKNPRKWKDRLARVSETAFSLTSTERSRILLANIYGVDIDTQAVGVTKLSLLLKVLEKTPGEAIDLQLRLSHERALPDLGENIKCGNSVIAPDFYAMKQTTLFDSEEARKVNVFDWQREFSSVFTRANGGFDAIIGNPPYIPIELLSEDEKRYVEQKNPELERKYDSSVIFILAMLPKLRSSGKLGFISSITWQTGENYARIRQKALKDYGLEKLVNLPYDVFKDAYVDTGIYVISAKPTTEYGLFRFPKHEKYPNLETAQLESVSNSLIRAPDFKLVLDPVVDALLSRLTNAQGYVPLGEMTISTQGLAAGRFHTVQDGRAKTAYPFLRLGQVYRYSFEPSQVDYVDMSPFPTLCPHYEARSKILIRRVISRDDRLLCSFFNGRMVFKKDINPFTLIDSGTDPMYLLGILNSRLMSYLYLNTSSIATKDDFRQTTLAELRRLPIRVISEGDRNAESHRERIAALATQLQDLCRRLPALRTGDERTALLRQLDGLDSQLDNEVNSLYSLSNTEADTISGATKPASWRVSKA